MLYNVLGAAEELTEVVTNGIEQDNFSINLNCNTLYSIIKNKETSDFNVTLHIQEKGTIPITMKVLPVKAGGKHMSSPFGRRSMHQLFVGGSITIEATVYNPNKNCDLVYGRLGEMVWSSELLPAKTLDAVVTSSNEAAQWGLSLEKLMLEMHVFYCSQIQIDIIFRN